jgi:hypothetical protein
MLVADLAGKFAGRKTFIEQVEEVVPLFHKDIGEHLRAYVPPPPRITKDPSGKQDEEPADEQSLDKVVVEPAAASGTPESKSEPLTEADERADKHEHRKAEAALVFYYVDASGEQQGPCAASDLRALRTDGKLTAESFVFRAGEEEWKAFAQHFPE